VYTPLAHGVLLSRTRTAQQAHRLGVHSPSTAYYYAELNHRDTALQMTYQLYSYRQGVTARDFGTMIRRSTHTNNCETPQRHAAALMFPESMRGRAHETLRYTVPKAFHKM
jgi:hypothetical protein